jgi:hypothetical protein
MRTRTQRRTSRTCARGRSTPSVSSRSEDPTGRDGGQKHGSGIQNRTPRGSPQSLDIRGRARCFGSLGLVTTMPAGRWGAL